MGDSVSPTSVGWCVGLSVGVVGVVVGLPDGLALGAVVRTMIIGGIQAG